jgi:hypothetical protein
VHGNAKANEIGERRKLLANQVVDLDAIPFLSDEQVVIGRKSGRDYLGLGFRVGCKSRVASISMTLDVYRHLFPRVDEGAS